MLLNLKPFSTNYKLRTTNYKEKGTAHDGINLHATVPFANCDLRDALWASPTTLVPTGHGQVVLGAFGHEDLVDVDVADVEGYGAAAEVEVPHAGEFFAAGSDDFIADVLEVIEPAHEGLIVMAAQAFDVDDLEVIYHELSP